MWKKYAKIWTLLKMYTWAAPIQISKYATEWAKSIWSNYVESNFAEW